MKGTIRDDGSRSTGGYRIKSKIFRRLRPGETNLTILAPGLRILNRLENHLSQKTSQAVLTLSTLTHKKSVIIGFTFFTIFFLTSAANAVLVFESPLDSLWQSVDGVPASQDYIRKSSNVFYPWWVYGHFNEGDNVEWVYPYREYQYLYLDNTLYRLLGGSFQPCSIGTCWPEFKYLKEVHIHYIAGREYVDFWGRFSFSGEPAQLGDRLSANVGDFNAGQYIVSDPGWYVFRVYRDDPLTANIDGAAPGDIITFKAIEQSTGLIHSTVTSGNVPIWTHHQDRVRVDINALPEPATILLFGLGVLGVRVIRKKSRSSNFQR